jgi:pilus assembly protein CpaF
MLSIIIAEKAAEPRRLDFDKDEITIGRVDDNDVVLPRGNISKKHTRFVQKGGRVIVVDLKSTNGTFVNGKKLVAPQVISGDDKVNIGDFTLSLANGEAEIAEPPSDPAHAPPPPIARRPDAMPANGVTISTTKAAAPTSNPARPPPAPKDSDEPEVVRHSPTRKKQLAALRAQSVIEGERQEWARLLKLCHDRLIEAMDLRRLDMERLGDEELWRRTEQTVRGIIQKMDALREIPPEVDREQLITDVLNEALGLGPLEAFLGDDEISEIMVNHASQIYIEKKGKLAIAHKTFSSNEAVRHVIERIVAPLGRRIDESSPLVDARLRDGSRVNAIIPPLALKGPALTIRKFKRERLRVKDLLAFGTITTHMVEFLETCVKVRKNMVISGGTGSGKTTLLNIMSSFIPEDERIITVEDAAELQLPQEHWVQLETRPANIEGKGQISIRDLVRNCLRMRPDRIVVGECRGGEALDMLQAMNTGHDGSLTTLHANSPRDALSRLETMVLMSGMELPIKAIREQVASAVNMIVQQNRFADGSRKVTAITEVSGMEGETITLQDIFLFRQEGFDDEGHVRGRYVSTGFVPRFYDDLQRRGIPVNMEIFRED